MPEGSEPAGLAGQAGQPAQIDNPASAPDTAEVQNASSANKRIGSSIGNSAGSEAGGSQANLLTCKPDVICNHVAPHLPATVLSAFRASCSQLQNDINPEDCEHLSRQKAMAESLAKGQCNADASCWLIPPSWDSHPRKLARAPNGLFNSSSFICQLWEKTNDATSEGISTYSLLITETVSGYAAQIKLFDGVSYSSDNICIDWLTPDQLLVRFKEKQNADCRGLLYHISSHAGVSLQQDFLFSTGTDSLFPLGLPSPDGFSLLCQGNSNSACILSLPAGAQIAQLQLPDVTHQLTSMQWAPANSNQLYIAATSAAAASASAAHLHVFAAETGALLHSTQLPEHVVSSRDTSEALKMDLTWAPGGRAIAISMEPGMVLTSTILSKSSRKDRKMGEGSVARPAADQSALPEASSTDAMRLAFASVQLQSKDFPFCKWDPSGQGLACFAGRKGEHGCLVHVATGSILHEWGRQPESEPEPEPERDMPAMFLKMMGFIRPRQLIREPSWLDEAQQPSLFVPAIHQVISVHFLSKQGAGGIEPSVVITELPLSTAAQPSPCGRLYVDVEDTGAETKDRLDTKLAFHYSPDTGSMHHLGVRVCRRDIENVTLMVQPSQLILQWIPDLASSLVYACISQDAIYLVDGLRHNKLSEIHTETLITGMGIIPCNHLGLADEQQDIIRAGNHPETVLNDPQYVFLMGSDSSNEVMRWEALEWSSDTHQLILTGSDTLLVIAFDGKSNESDPPQQLSSRLSPAEGFTTHNIEKINSVPA